MTKVSPIAQFLIKNQAIAKRDRNGCNFISPEGLYLGRMTKMIVNNYRVISVNIFGEGLKKLYTKSTAIGQQYSYIVNKSSPIGISIVPVKSYIRKIFVDFIEQTRKVEDCEKTLTNKLDLIAIDEQTGTGLYDTSKPFSYSTKITHSEFKKLKHPQFVHTKH